ncbi:MAG: segregation and condensation protein B, partial [Paracoccaceae bacterium]
MSRTPSAPLDPFASLFDAPPIAEQERMIEALLFAAADPMTEADLTRRMPEGSN